MAPSARTIRLGDEAYPACLRRLHDAPETVHVDGSLDGLERAVAIVGTRRATPAALAFTHELARTLAEAGVVIVSGGAEGVDAAAHEGALESESGRTVAVLPTAIASPFPVAHAALFARIATRGARMTEHADGSATYASHFLERNRIIAALSRALVVVQAPFRSGALRTAADARGLSIPVLAVPWSPTERAAVGGLALLAGGAKLCRDAADVLAAIGEPATATVRRPRSRRSATVTHPDAAALFSLLDDVALDREALLARVALPVARAQAALLRLVLSGDAIEDAHGIRRRPRR